MRVLVIEDDPLLSRAMTARLAGQGFIVESASSGNQGARMLADGGFDACILDVVLPDLHGFRVLELAREQGFNAPVILVSASCEIDDRVHGLNLGADDFLSKPFHYSELVARLHAIARRGLVRRDSPLGSADISLDRRTRKLVVRGREIEMPRKAMAIVELLLEHIGEVVPRAELLQKVWGYSSDPGTNIIDVQIAKIRACIDEPGARSLIETVRGVGFRIHATSGS